MNPDIGKQNGAMNLVEQRLSEATMKPIELALEVISSVSDNDSAFDYAKGWFTKLVEMSKGIQTLGKKFRARLAINCSKFFNLPAEIATSLGAFVEMIQTASLVHDDVVDEADKRRGQKTINSRMGNRFAVLTGDYILSLALQELSSIGCEGLVPVFSNVVSQMTLGEAMELECYFDENRKMEHYISTISLKTASLLAFSTYAPAIIAKQSESVVKTMMDFGLNLGMSFQLVDDVLDFVGPDGKKRYKDLEQGLATPPIILLSDTKDIFKTDGDSLVERATSEGTLKKTIDIAVSHTKKALDCLSSLDQRSSTFKDNLVGICFEIYDRLPSNLKPVF
ncbi:MAG TPA: polyprenyl synthetase family protein [Caldisericia bacterium]|nr:polyprenyl synthetase family protein [Caldisericia bacterium]HPF48119.1 polyprenyl synthetase family protein [Caldisericia bacterium]HPI83944.1 polyprenyl synthetase family protein [Caldisericia bacterium]HPQ92572.1 polyprenyl synthetase family protein [Caldisericia bacterium]HRV74330.1 polyprenyl synthetase family protein [Caldisericia bacterium]